MVSPGSKWVDGLQTLFPALAGSEGREPTGGGPSRAARPVFLVLHFDPERLTSKILFFNCIL